MGRTTRVGGGRAPQLNFPVTAEIIETAVPKDSAHCMIADGLKAAMPKATDVSVDLATIRFSDRESGRRYIYLTPPVAQVSLLKFDHGEKPEPFVVKAHAAQIIKTAAKRASDRKTAAKSLALKNDSKEVKGSAGLALENEPDEPTNVRPEGTPETISEPPALALKTDVNEAPEMEGLALKMPPPERATLMNNPAGGGTVPIKIGGNAPPLGPLAHGTGTHKVHEKYRVGKMRGFGLRVMGR